LAGSFIPGFAPTAKKNNNNVKYRVRLAGPRLKLEIKGALCDEEFHDLYSSPKITVFNSMGMKLVGVHRDTHQEMGTVCRMLV
jgi:hypothetical protein